MISVPPVPPVSRPSSSPEPASPRRMGLLSGVGLTVANMVGVGVLTNTGYMAGRLGPWEILLAWLVWRVI